MTRVAAGRSPLDEIVLGGDPLVRLGLVDAPRRAGARAGRAGSHVTSQTSSHDSASPPSTSLIASMATAGAPAASAAATSAISIRGRTAGWTIASRSREGRRIRRRRAVPSAARSSEPSGGR